MTIENGAHPARISCGDETNLSVQLLDQFDNIVPLESLKTAYHNMLMRGLELRYLKEGRLAAAYNYDASKWCISASLKLEYTGLVIAGEDDLWTPPRFQTYLGEHLPHVRVVLLPETGHSPFVERADEFNAELERFLAGLP